ncbi:hypothetical protein [Natrinema sp. DC36]|uniref:hypothetical protein n=1 Tax=Natrinema sp. DC36 TaxID=2878680 RepID=UPI001CF0AE1F|nr:hypothetical protein [Natrinema sp. DC36]
MRNLDNFERLSSGLDIVLRLNERIEDDEDNNVSVRMNEVRSYLARASEHVGSNWMEEQFKKSMGLAASIALNHGHDDLAEEAMTLGGEINEV